MERQPRKPRNNPPTKTTIPISTTSSLPRSKAVLIIVENTVVVSIFVCDSVVAHVAVVLVLVVLVAVTIVDLRTKVVVATTSVEVVLVVVVTETRVVLLVNVTLTVVIVVDITLGPCIGECRGALVLRETVIARANISSESENRILPGLIEKFPVLEESLPG